MKTKKLYWIKSDRSHHFNLNYSWIELANELDVNIEIMISVELLGSQKIKNFIRSIRKKKGVKIIYSPVKYTRSLSVLFYVVLQILLGRRVRVISKKIHAKWMICLSKRIPTRFQFGIELEGDLKSEIEYLRAHYYKKHFYDKTIAQMSAALKRQNYYLAAAKGIIVVSDELKVQMQNAEVSSKNVYWTTGTGFSREHIRFCEFSRKIIRDQLNITGVCLIYIGNVFYSWQNISDTLLYFKRFNLDCPESKFIVLTPRSQFGIVEYFAKIHQISLNKICLRSVRNEEVYKYLSAADVGVLLRKDSTVNKVSCPGKVGEYLAAGLPCVLTKYIGDYEKSLRDKDFVSMLSLTESQEYVISEITRLSRISLSFRRQISIFAKQEFSALKNIKNFVAAFDWQPSSSVREGLNKSS